MIDAKKTRRVKYGPIASLRMYLEILALPVLHLGLPVVRVAYKASDWPSSGIVFPQTGLAAMMNKRHT